MTNRFVRTTCVLVALTVSGRSAAFAQMPHTWVSGVGDDVNTCGRTDPCKTFSGAISKTDAGGQISVLDPGGFGAVSITKSITIDGISRASGVLVTGVNGILINAGPADVVRLLHLQINGLANPLARSPVGIRFNSGAALIIDDVLVHGFVTGIETYVGKTVVKHSLIAQNSSFGVNVVGGTVTMESSVLTNNYIAAQAMTAGTLRLSNTDIFNNTSGLGCGGGTLASAGNNRKAGNPGGVAAVCAPTVAITVF
jgi:hypothetical protein